MVYSLGGEASPEEYAAALHCDPDHLCFAKVLEANECEAAAVVTGPERDARGAVPLSLVRANFKRPLFKHAQRGTRTRRTGHE
ncbi:MAG: hypothetical protein AB8H86_08530 [Polyangiales bacterium]